MYIYDIPHLRDKMKMVDSSSIDEMAMDMLLTPYRICSTMPVHGDCGSLPYKRYKRYKSADKRALRVKTMI